MDLTEKDERLFFHNKEKNLLKKSFLGLILSQCKTHWWSYLLGLVFLILTHGIQAELPVWAKRLAEGKVFQGMEFALLFFFALGIIFFRTASRKLFFNPARIMQRELRYELLQSITLANPFQYRHLKSGEIFQILTGDIDQIRALIGFVGLQLGNIIVALAIIIPKLFQFEPVILLALIPMFLSFVIFAVIVMNNRSDYKDMQKALGLFQNAIIEAFHGKKTLQNFHSELHYFKIFSEKSKVELDLFKKTSRVISVSLPLVPLGLGLTLASGAYLLYHNGHGAVDFVFFSAFIFLLMEPMNYLSWIGLVISRSNASWDRLRNTHRDITTANSITKNLQESFQKFDAIPFWDQHLSFGGPQKFLGQISVFLGPTGVGKTEILLKLERYFSQKGLKSILVLQEPFIFNDSIENNIILQGLNFHDVNRSDMLRDAKDLLKLFGLNFIEENLENLLALEVGENGKKLSGGQCKRLVLLRSLLMAKYQKIPILIWDDPFSSIDLLLEKEIMEQLILQKYFLEKTLIFTSHRMSSLKYAGQYFLLDKQLGVVESGVPNEERLESGTKLHEFFKIQMA